MAITQDRPKTFFHNPSRRPIERGYSFIFGATTYGWLNTSSHHKLEVRSNNSDLSLNRRDLTIEYCWVYVFYSDLIRVVYWVSQLPVSGPRVFWYLYQSFFGDQESKDYIFNIICNPKL